MVIFPSACLIEQQVNIDLIEQQVSIDFKRTTSKY